MVSFLRASLFLTSLLLFGCGDDAASNNGDTNNGDTNNGGAEACPQGQFEQFELFDEHEDFFFEFAHPAEWVTVDTSSEDAISGNVSTADYSVSIQYAVLKMADNGSGVEEIWQEQHDVVDEIVYDGAPVTVYSQEDLAIQATMLMPHAGNFYQVSMIFAGPDECLEERRALRQLFLDELEPNPDTTFMP